MNAKRFFVLLLSLCMVVCTFAVSAVEDSEGVASIGGVLYASLAEAIEAAEEGAEVELLADVTITATLMPEVSLTIDGNGNTITVSGTKRGIDVLSATQGASLTLKNLTIANTKGNYFERAINYNTNGTLTLENVTVSGATYAINLPGNSDGATVNIKDSDISSKIALNIWGENVVATVTDSTLTAVDETETENYAAIVLNNDGATSAEGTTVTVNGGSVKATGDSYAVSNGTSTGEIIINDGVEVEGETIKSVAVIRYENGTSYSFTTLKDAFEKAAAGDTVELIADVELTEGLKVAADDEFTFDLAGHTVTLVEEIASASALLINEGTFTIEDSSENGTGAIYYTATNPDGSDIPGYASNVINNYGSLTVNGGELENKTNPAGPACYVVDNYTGTLTINGGKLATQSYAVRQAPYNYREGMVNSVIINDGELEGYRAVWIQLPSNNNSLAPEVNLTINGGTLTSTDGNYNSAIFVRTEGMSYANTNINITGGTFNGAIALTGPSSNPPAVTENVSITGGTFNACDGTFVEPATIYSYSSTMSGIISGGTFEVLPAEGLIDKDFEAEEVDGKFTVVKKENPEEPADDIFGTLLFISNMEPVEKDGKDYYPLMAVTSIKSHEYGTVGFKFRAVRTGENPTDVTQEAETTTVFRALNVKQSDGSMKRYTAEQYDMSYMYGNEIRFNAANWTNENTTLFITPFATIGEERFEGKTYQITSDVLNTQLFNEEAIQK